MKKVCFVVLHFPIVSETFVTNHVVQAKLRGFDTLVLTNHLMTVDNSSQKELLLKHNILADAYPVDYKIPSSKIKRLLYAFLLIIKYFKYWLRAKNMRFKHRLVTLPFQIAFYNQFKDVSVFHIQFALAGFEIAQMKSIGLFSGRIITTFHGYDAHFKNKQDLKFLKQRYNLLLKASDYLTVNTAYLGKKVEALGGIANRIKVIPMGVDLEFFKPQIEKRISDNAAIKLISIGRLIELKGFEYAIRSVKIIVDKGYNVVYTIIGDGVEKDKLQRIIDELRLSNIVRLVGVKNQQDIKYLLDESHVFLMSSITDQSNRAEAQGVVTIEAQAMGLPVVAFRSGGVPYTVIENETGFLVNERDIDGYAQKVMKLIDDRNLYNTMSHSAKEFVLNNFSTKDLAKAFFKLYD